MIPKLFLDYSYPYNRLFNKILGKSFSDEDLIELKEKYAKFEKLYYKYAEKILELIEKYNEPWQKKVIRIYPAGEMLPFSVSSPLTLKYDENERYLLVVLIHELIHNNFFEKKFPNRKELHQYIAKIMEKVCSELDLDLEEERKKLEEITTK
ncbi:MAG TPA: hypothetical protein PLK34_01440 [Candidatus Pacearchaeota archaeon]|nr:hypothetical protein [Candidatus Pacearchaeota archaeon]